jgi:hypothetical protein
LRFPPNIAPVLWKWQNAVTGKRRGILVVPRPIPTVWSLQLCVNCGHYWCKVIVQRKLAPRVLLRSRAYIRVGSGAEATPSSRRLVCPPSAPVRQIEGLHEWEFWFIVAKMKQKSVPGKARHYPTPDKAALFGKRKDPHRAGGGCGRGEHLRAVAAARASRPRCSTPQSLGYVPPGVDRSAFEERGWL